MLSTILVPLDGSVLAERALPFAERVAASDAVRIVLLRASLARSMPPTDPFEDEARLAAAAEAYLSGVAARLGERGCSVQVAAPRAAPARAILVEAATRPADLIVMSTHGRGGLGRWIYGSVADQVLRHAEVPILLIPANCELPWPSDRALRILVPLDGSDFAQEALGPTIALAEQVDADLLLLQVAEPPDYGLHARAYLSDVAAMLRQRGMAVELHDVLGHPGPEIANVAREQGADLIAMATHGRGGLGRLVLGSVMSETLHRARVPLLVVRPTALSQALPRPTTGVAELDLEASGASVSLRLSQPELALIDRGLADLLYSPESDWYLADTLRPLVERIKAAEAAASTVDGSAAPL